MSYSSIGQVAILLRELVHNITGYSVCDLVKICSEVCCAIPDMCGQLLGALKAICLPSRKPSCQHLVERVNVRNLLAYSGLSVCLSVCSSVCPSVCVCVCMHAGIYSDNAVFNVHNS